VKFVSAARQMRIDSKRPSLCKEWQVLALEKKLIYLVYQLCMTRDKPKYQQLFDAIEQGVSSGRYLPGQKLPSEAALEAEFGISRITVVRALRELQQRRGRFLCAAGVDPATRQNKSDGRVGFYRIPRDVRIVGIDDLQYAKLLPVSLTPVHQPCRELDPA
jgi:hypothetical protein